MWSIDGDAAGMKVVLQQTFFLNFFFKLTGAVQSNTHLTLTVNCKFLETFFV